MVLECTTAFVQKIFQITIFPALNMLMKASANQKCVKWKQIIAEILLPGDIRFYYKFQSDPVTDKPSWCPGLVGE